MRTAILILIFALLPVSTWGHDQVASWPLDELSGITCVDATGNGLDGTATGTTIIDGRIGKCRSFIGSGEYIEVPDNDLLDITDRITIMFWARTDQPFSSPNAVPLIKRVTDGDINYAVVFGNVMDVTTSGSSLASGLAFQFEYAPCVLYGTYFEFHDDNWHHYAISLEFGNPSSAVWVIDGTQRSGWWQYDNATPAAGTEMPSANNYPLRIGGQISSSPGYWNGELDQIGIYNQALTVEEIRRIYYGNRIGLFVQNVSSLDAEESAAHSFATSHDFNVTLIDPSAILEDPGVLDNVDAFWAANNSEPAGFDNETITEAIRTRIDAGKGMMVSWYGSYLVKYMGLGTTAPGASWSPTVSDHEYWVDADDEHPIFDGLADWVPPTGYPDDETKLISYVTPGYIPIGSIAVTWWVPAYNRDFTHVWASYGWCGQPINNDLCDQYGVTCTCERGLHQSHITEAHVMNGAIMVGPYAMAGGDHWNWGPIGYEILENMLNYLCGGVYQHPDREVLLYTTRNYGDVNGICRRGAYDEDLPEVLAAGGFHLMSNDRESMPTMSHFILGYYDQLWFLSTEYGTVLNSDEEEAFHRFHAAGKGIMVIADSYSYAGSANLVSLPYGVSFSGEVNHCGGSVGCPVSTEDFYPHEIWSDVADIEANLNEGHITATSPAQVIATHNGINMAAVYDDGCGRIAWDATYYRFSDDTTHPNLSILYYDNSRYALNLANWLDGSCPLPSKPYIGLFADTNRESMRTDCIQFQEFDVYVHCLPSINGQMGAEFSVQLPYNVFLTGSQTFNTFVASASGDILNGITLEYSDCQNCWNWVMKFQAIAIAPGSSYICIADHPATSDIRYTSCFAGPQESVTVFNQFGVYCDGLIATQLQSFNAGFDKQRKGMKVEWTLSELSPSAEFVMSRAEGGRGVFNPIQNPQIRKDGLNCSFIDEEIVSGQSYSYKIDVLDKGERQELFTTDLIAAPSLPLTLEQNYPNPFNPSTTISYYLPGDGEVSLEVFDVAGRRVAVLVDIRQKAGNHTAVWDGKNLNGSPVSSGIYFYRLEAMKESKTSKMILLR